MKNKIFLAIILFLILYLFLVSCKIFDNKPHPSIVLNTTKFEEIKSTTVRQTTTKIYSPEEEFAHKVIQDFLNGNPNWDYIFVPNCIKFDYVLEWYNKFKNTYEFTKLKEKPVEEVSYTIIKDKIYINDLFVHNIKIMANQNLEFEINGVNSKNAGFFYDNIISGFNIPYSLKDVKIIIKNKYLNAFTIYQYDLKDGDILDLKELINLDLICFDFSKVSQFVMNFCKDIINYQSNDNEELLNYFENKNNLTYIDEKLIINTENKEKFLDSLQFNILFESNDLLKVICQNNINSFEVYLKVLEDNFQITKIKDIEN